MSSRALLLRSSLIPAVIVVVTAGLSACGVPGSDSPADALSAPELGACHRLDPVDLTKATEDSDSVACTEDHNTETFLVGNLPASTGSSYDDRGHGKYVYKTCNAAFVKFLGGEESTALRSQLSWSWFRASEKGWSKGARWFRCDVVGGPDGARSLRSLPDTAQGLFSGRPQDAWMTCAVGDTVSGSRKVPCSEKHDWRAATTIKIGAEGDPYPGDRISEVRSRDYCSESVGAWMNYPTDYEFGYTWFHEAEWTAGNRRAICWAKTDQ